MPVYGADGKPVSHRQLDEQLRKVIDRSSYVGPPLGVMTADGRTKWGKVYQRMCKGSAFFQPQQQTCKSIITKRVYTNVYTTLSVDVCKTLILV